MQAFLFVRWMRTEYKCKCESDTWSTEAYGGNQLQRVQQSKVTEMMCCKKSNIAVGLGSWGLLWWYYWDAQCVVCLTCSMMGMILGMCRALSGTCTTQELKEIYASSEIQEKGFGKRS